MLTPFMVNFYFATTVQFSQCKVYVYSVNANAFFISFTTPVNKTTNFYENTRKESLFNRVSRDNRCSMGRVASPLPI
ncbi:hypothetical protein NIASO_00500 [Niabella soli DSM 19437]|uniref:Uncharacterized protein n=1 Tax=Niabella soli DSM 19437 TaxID=929713 RepID=W0F6M9_9BACT|nr:hypothetical protein NIASO_00500 [Niabella soli DSM 19437]